ncbi:MAG: Tm-1-like ATP-binding domain-containing protein [Deltaproteobacteria bacterium]|nr:Tm-1-like ATP-binding domain-containing protein [Deltaproteobacteria bacterium]
MDKRGSYFYDGEADTVFVTQLKKHLRRNIEVREVDADLESSEFAKAVVETFDEIMQA